TGHGAAPRLEWYALQLILQLGGPAEVCLRLKEPLIVRTRNVSDVGLAKSDRRFDQRIEHHLKIECRPADDLEHVGGGGLLLQRFAQLVEQARVLYGDDGLLGEARHQRDLLVGERAHLLTVEIDGSDQLISFEHWDRDHRPIASQLASGDDGWNALNVG